jgi:hypothetical protein
MIRFSHESPSEAAPPHPLQKRRGNQRVLTKSWATKSFSALADMPKARQQPDKDDLFMILSPMILSKNSPV